MEEQLQIDQEELIQAWKQELPNFLNEGDSSDVTAGAGPQSLRINIQVAGRSKYDLDFDCTYMDTREVKVERVDVEKDNRSVDEHTEIIQNLVDDYIRLIHECAQSLKKLTTANV